MWEGKGEKLEDTRMYVLKATTGSMTMQLGCNGLVDKINTK